MEKPPANPLDRYPDKEVASVCGKLVGGLASDWMLTHDELCVLLGPDADVDALLAKPTFVPKTVIDRVGLLIGIDSAACTLLPIRKRATDYLRKPNPELNGQSAMSIMLQGSEKDLESVHRFLSPGLSDTPLVTRVIPTRLIALNLLWAIGVRKPKF